MLVLLQVLGGNKQKKKHKLEQSESCTTCIYFSGFYYDQILKLQLLKQYKKTLQVT